MTMPTRIWAAPDDAYDTILEGQFGVWTSAPADLGEDDEAAAYIRLDAIATAPEVQAMIDAAVKAERERHDQPKMSESDFDCLILDAIAEATKAMRKFPQPNYVISKVAEEAGEVVKAAIHCAEGRETAENVRGEMKQLIAMLYRLWVEGDQVHGLPSIAAAIRSQS